MSLTIVTTTPEGIVFASDSRNTFRNRKGVTRVSSDFAEKITPFSDFCGVSVNGPAFIHDGKGPKGVLHMVQALRRSIDANQMDVKEIAEAVHDHIQTQYSWKEQLDVIIQQISDDIRKRGGIVQDVQQEQGFANLSFLNAQGKKQNQQVRIDPIYVTIAGYNQDGSHEVYNSHTPGNLQQLCNSAEAGKEYGASWNGQSDVISRIMHGFDPRIQNLQMMRDVMQEKGQEQFFQQLRGLEYNFQWGTMTLQDAVNFSSQMLKTTAMIQNLSDGILADPGDFANVGGPVDIALVTPDQGFVWLQKKAIQSEDNSVELDFI